MHSKRLFLLFWLCFSVLIVSPAAIGYGQTPTPPPTATQPATPTPIPPTLIPTQPPPTATNTETPTVTFFLTLTPAITTSPTQTNTEIPTETLIPMITETPDSSATASLTLTTVPIFTETATPTQTATGIGTETYTPIAVVTAPPTSTPDGLPDEPDLVEMFAERFELGEGDGLSNWVNTNSWIYEEANHGSGLYIVNSSEELKLNRTDLQNYAVEVELTQGAGKFKLITHRNSSHYYTVTVDMLGIVALYRSDILLQSTVVNPVQAGAWRSLRFSSFDGVLRVSVDGQQLFAYLDSSYLAAGEIAMRFDFAEAPGPVNIGGVDNFVIFTQSPTESQGINSASDAIENVPLIENIEQPLQSVSCVPGSLPSSTANLIAYERSGGSSIYIDEFAVDASGRPLRNGSGNASDLFTIASLGTPLSGSTYAHSIHEPTISPDGTRVAYITNYGFGSNPSYTHLGLNILDLTTCQITVVLSPDANIKYSPSWSPDGSQIVYEWIDEYSGNREIRIIDSQNVSGYTFVAYGRTPVWSPVDDKIAFINPIGNLSLYDISDNIGLSLLSSVKSRNTWVT